MIHLRLKKRWEDMKRSAKRSAARAYYSLPALSQRNPRRRITTIGEYCQHVSSPAVDISADISAWYSSMLSQESVSRALPCSISNAQAAAFEASTVKYQHGRTCPLPEVFLAGVSDAVLYSRDFLVLSPDRRIFFESALSTTQILENNGILDRLTWPSPSHIHRPAFLLAQSTPRAYYHWVIEMLPKLSLLEQVSEFRTLPLVTSTSLTPFQSESLHKVGVTPDRVIQFDGSCWKFDRLLFSMPLGPTGCPAPKAVSWLRDRFLPHHAPLANPRKRIYLTRRDALQRRVLNEPQIISFLSSMGFEVVCPGEMSFSAQIQLFSKVEVVVAAHGAGVTNIVFAPPEAILIEFFGENYINGCFWAITSIIKQRYGFLVGPSQWLDYTISIEDLRVLLKKLGII